MPLPLHARLVYLYHLYVPRSSYVLSLKCTFILQEAVHNVTALGIQMGKTSFLANSGLFTICFINTVLCSSKLN